MPKYLPDDRYPVSADLARLNPELAAYLCAADDITNRIQAPVVTVASTPDPMDGAEQPKGKGRAKRSRGGQTEAQLQAIVIDLLRKLGYQYVYHTHNSRFSEAGFPDVLAIRLEVGCRRFVVIEFKRGNAELRPAKYTKKGRWVPGQQDWLIAFNGMGAESYVVRTGDNMEELAEVLR